MAVMTPRESWSDERLDDLKTHMDEGFREVRAEIRDVRAEVRLIRGEMGEVRGEIGQLREELGEVRAEVKGLEKNFDAKFDALNRTLQIGFGLIGSFLGVLGILIATQL